MSPKSITQREIAERLGVSIATVSRALNDQPGVSPEVRAKILESAQEMGYSPNAQARSLATARTYTIGYVGYKHGFVLPANLMFGSVTPAPLEGIDEELTRRGYHMLTTYVDKDGVRRLEVPSMVHQGRVDGLIVNGPAISPRFILQLRNTDLPIVLVDNVLKETAVDSILCDNEGGTYQAVQHLIEHGHARIVFLSGPVDWLSSRERAAGYHRAMHDAGLESHVVYMPNTIVDTGREGMLAALEEYPDLTAVMAVNDATAVGAVQACHQAGRAVPDDVAVIGFDDEPWAQIHQPPLTTVRVHWHEIGIQAARRIVDIIEQDSRVPVQMRLAAELVVRLSCGCHTE
jgi:LacI family transcriptional regulator